MPVSCAGQNSTELPYLNIANNPVHTLREKADAKGDYEIPDSETIYSSQLRRRSSEYHRIFRLCAGIPNALRPSSAFFVSITKTNYNRDQDRIAARMNTSPLGAKEARTGRQSRRSLTRHGVVARVRQRSIKYNGMGKLCIAVSIRTCSTKACLSFPLEV